MNRTILFLSILMALCVGCKRVEVDFSYSPTVPRAGQTVAFSNLCTEGEKWAWDFGDNTTSVARSPYKIYKKPGTYMVTLMVDSAKYQTCTKEITVYDTVPTFVYSTDSVLHYQNVQFTANVYNPFSHTLTYEWIVSDNCHVLSSTTTGSTLNAYFKSPVQSDSVTLILTLKGVEYRITKHFVVNLTKAPAIVQQRLDNTILRQRIINDRIEDCKPAVKEDEALINTTSDTMVVFNGTTFYASQLPNLVEGFADIQVQHIQLDPMAQKWYVVTPDGLFVANFDGSQQELIDSSATGALHVDMERNRLYWANINGLFALPLIKSKNNQFTSEPSQYNNLSDIKLITIDNNRR